MRNVEPGQVEQLERSHAETGALAQDAVDVAAWCDAFVVDFQRFGAVGASQVVDDESRRVLGAYAAVAHAFGQCQQRITYGRVGGEAVDDFDHLHQRYRIEEVETGNPFRHLAGTGNGRHRQRRSVGGEDAVRRDNGFQPGQQFLFGVQPFDDGFDHHVAIGQRFQRVDNLQALKGRRCGNRFDLALGNQFVERGGQAGPGASGRTVAGVKEAHGQTGLGGDLGDAAAHDAGADQTEDVEGRGHVHAPR